jgi:hypothetical protein
MAEKKIEKCAHPGCNCPPAKTLLYGFFTRPFRDLLRANDLVELIRARAAQPPAEDQAPVSAEAE